MKNTHHPASTSNEQESGSVVRQIAMRVSEVTLFLWAGTVQQCHTYPRHNSGGSSRYSSSR